VTKLEYTFKSDTLFKTVFVKYPELLKKLTAELLGIAFESIEAFEITNPDIPPDAVGDKYCRLDINMTVDGQWVDLEIQVTDEGDYPERSLYYWAREYSSAVKEGQDYIELPRTVHISILAFSMFDCEEFHSEFQLLEVKRHIPLTDKQILHYFELPKLPKEITKENELHLWLSLFKAETKEDIEKIEAMEVSVMKEAIEAYRQVTATSEFRELERLRERARHNEAAALRHARQEERKKWQGLVAKKDEENEELRKQLVELQAKLNN
jgi:predicted transposase/invertase (TIGR01784 family)